MTFTAVPERPILDLRYKAWETVFGGIRAIGTWNLHSKRPCMVLLPASARISPERVTPIIIDMDDAWKWTEEHGDPAECAVLVMNWIAAGFLPGSPTNNRDYWHVFDIVRSRLNDLLNMPPAPARNPEIMGDMTITYHETGIVQQKDIVDDV